MEKGTSYKTKKMSSDNQLLKISIFDVDNNNSFLCIADRLLINICNSARKFW